MCQRKYLRETRSVCVSERCRVPVHSCRKVCNSCGVSRLLKGGAWVLLLHPGGGADLYSYRCTWSRSTWHCKVMYYINITSTCQNADWISVTDCSHSPCFVINLSFTFCIAFYAWYIVITLLTLTIILFDVSFVEFDSKVVHWIATYLWSAALDWLSIEGYVLWAWFKLWNLLSC